jgi:hypothetical protein
MKLISTGAALLAATVLALPANVLAQTEQQRLNEAMAMQRGIYSQDAAANLDEAIGIYREIAGPRTSDRALAAEAQYRLSQALLQKGDLTGASEAMVVLSTNFPDQAERISQIAGSGVGLVMSGQRSGGGGGRGGPRAGGPPVLIDPSTFTAEQRRQMEKALSELLLAQRESLGTIYDRDFVAGATRTLTTAVENMSWTNPQSWLRISDGATRWNLLLPAPNMLIRLGMTRETLRVGEQVTVVLTMDASGTPLTDGSMFGRVESIVRVADGVTVFDRAAMLEPEQQ